MADPSAASPPSPPSVFSFETHPSRYRHWTFSVDGNVARLGMATDTDHALRPGYDLKLNSYDLAVDIELADAIQRLRFEHPEVRAVVVTSDRDRVFCAGANIFMLGSSTHGFKVNFCKFTNETRLAIEDASAHSGQRYLAACNGPTAGGGYELALACDEILLIDDGSSTVSLPEVPLLGVLPGTGGLTRVVDKRMVRRDLADVFSTTAEGIKGKRALEWRLVDGVVPRSKWAPEVQKRAAALAARAYIGPSRIGPGVALPSIEPRIEDRVFHYRHVTLSLDAARRTAELTIAAPVEPEPATAEAIFSRGADLWALRAFRELDDALLRLRFHHEEIGVVLLRAVGDPQLVLAADSALAHAAAPSSTENGGHWFAREVVLHMARVLRRLDQTAKSLFAVAEPGACFAGSLVEIALAADRVYALDDPRVKFAAGPLSTGALPLTHGPTRLAARFSGSPAHLAAALALTAPVDAASANDAGLVTVLADEIDFADELRVAVEERASLSPDALTGMEASLRCVGAESAASKIFGRLTAWQNWIFIRPNATGPTGALTMYGRPERPAFDFRRT